MLDFIIWDRQTYPLGLASVNSGFSTWFQLSFFFHHFLNHPTPPPPFFFVSILNIIRTSQLTIQKTHLYLISSVCQMHFYLNYKLVLELCTKSSKIESVDFILKYWLVQGLETQCALLAKKRTDLCMIFDIWLVGIVVIIVCSLITSSETNATILKIHPLSYIHILCGILL